MKAARTSFRAQRNIEAVYRENPEILGVVRATVDFYWSAKLYPQAIAVLQQAAKDAYPALGKQFTFEAARKSTEARQYQQARALIEPLLKNSPYDSQYLAAMADTYAAAGDQQGLKQFYLDEISQFRSAPLSLDERKSRIAALRRGLIPALTKRNDYSGAVDQYIEIINSFPEDEGLVAEATLYSLRYKRQAQLVDFYTKTVQQSPRDFRWPMVLARIQTNREDFPSAIDAYEKAIVIRPDRADLRIARAALAERLLRFDDAVGDYERIYQLAYKDPQWMEKIAELRARQGRNDDAVAALKTALIDVRPERAENYFQAARQLEDWGILEKARTFAEQGVGIAGGDLLASPQYHQGAKLYTRVMTRLRQQEKAYATLQTAFSAASSSFPVVQEQVAKEGVAGLSDREWRGHALQVRKDNARTGMQGAMTEMGAAVARYFTPEEKVSFAAFAQGIRGPMNLEDANLFALPLVHSAGLAEEEARWRYEIMMKSPENTPALMGQMSEFVEVQRQRVHYAELGAQLERFAPRERSAQRPTALLAAAEAYRAAGDSDGELRVLASVPPMYVGGDLQRHFFELLLEKQPKELVRIASSWTPFGEQAADFAVGTGDAELAGAVIAERARSRPPVWERSYTALVGLYLKDGSSSVNNAFRAALGDQSIGERLGKSVDRNNQLAGDVWFYYGSRYGEYLRDTKQGAPEDFLPAILEQSSASWSAYQTLADYYAGNGDTQPAIDDYQHALELSPGQTEMHDRLALAYYQDGKRSEAIAEWKLVFSTLSKQMDSTRVPESFWSDFGRACEHLHSRHLFAALQPDLDSVVRTYLHRNGNYRSNALLHSAYTAAGDPATATIWLLAVSSSARDPISILGDVVAAQWIPLEQRGPIYQRILESKQSDLAKAEGVEKESAQSELRSWQIRWLKYLIDTKQFAQADEFLVALPRDLQSGDASALVPFDLRIAAQLGRLDGTIAGYRSDPDTAPGAEILQIAARQIFEADDKQSARKILEFVFAREIDEHRLVAANFLGLAQIRIDSGDALGAVELLRRLVAVVGNPYENMESAASLLEKTGHPAEAIAFLEPLAKSTPWEPAFRARLAQAQIAAGANTSGAQEGLASIAAAPQNPYNQRVEAAVVLSGVRHGSEFGSAELTLLAGDSQSISIAAADRAFFYDARLRAAQNSATPQEKIQILSNALADTLGRDDARIPLFQAAASVRSDEFAMAAIDRLLREQRMRQVAPSNAAGEQEIRNADEDSTEQDEESPPLDGATNLLLAQQGQLAQSAGVVLMRLHRFSEALAHFRAAQKLEKSPARRKEIAAQINDARARLRRDQLNAARQPMLHAALEQDRLVRPRLVAASEGSTKPAAKSGEKP